MKRFAGVLFGVVALNCFVIGGAKADLHDRYSSFYWDRSSVEYAFEWQDLLKSRDPSMFMMCLERREQPWSLGLLLDCCMDALNSARECYDVVRKAIDLHNSHFKREALQVLRDVNRDEKVTWDPKALEQGFRRVFSRGGGINSDKMLELMGYDLRRGNYVLSIDELVKVCESQFYGSFRSYAYTDYPEWSCWAAVGLSLKANGTMQVPEQGAVISVSNDDFHYEAIKYTNGNL